MMQSLPQAQQSEDSLHVEKRHHFICSRGVKISLFILGLLYLSAAMIDFLIPLFKGKHLSADVCSRLLHSGIEHTIVASCCITGLVLCILRRRSAGNCVLIAAVVTGVVAVRALATSLASGFSMGLFIEPIAVLPCLFFIFRRFFDRRFL